MISLPCVTIQAQANDSTILCVNKTKDFEITGDGNPPNWINEKWLPLPQRNNNGISYGTKIKILCSDSDIYCLYYCQDNKLTSNLRQDYADLFNKDVIEAFFRTDEKVPIYFEYELSPFNYELSILVPNIRGNFQGWQPWHYKDNRKTRHVTHIIEKDGKLLGWTGEFLIPYELLKPLTNILLFPGNRWREIFYRIDYDNNESAWSWQLTRTNFHDYESFGKLLSK
jgi:hypothetical protein